MDTISDAIGYVSTVVSDDDFSCLQGISDLQQIAVGSDSSIYVADRDTKSVQRIKYGKVHTFVKGFSSPQGVAVDGDGNVFVSDTGANKIFKVKPTGENEVLCGSGKKAPEDGQGPLASLNQPHFLDYDSKSGCLFFTENKAVRKVRVAKQRLLHHDPTFSIDLMKLIDNSNIPSSEIVQFRVEGRLIQVSKTNLCLRSEYFQKMLQSGWKEGKSEGVIPIEETTYDAFHALITYLVAGILDVEKCRPIMTDILLLADKYIEGNLKDLCIRQLVKDLSLEHSDRLSFPVRKVQFPRVNGSFLEICCRPSQRSTRQKRFSDLSKTVITRIISKLDI